jgi:uncharacterized protein (DUF1330 family)
MPAYAVASYTITDPEGFRPYGPAVAPILAAHKAEVLAADNSSTAVEGSPGQTTVILRFPSKEAALAFYDSEEYQAIAHYRSANSDGSIVVCDEFVMPARET